MTNMDKYRCHLTDLLAMLEQYKKLRESWHDMMDDLEAFQPSQCVVHGWLWEFMKFEVKPAGEGESPDCIATLTLDAAIDDTKAALALAGPSSGQTP